VNGVAITQTDTVTVTPAALSASHSTLDAAPDTITASNGSSASTVTVTARDAFDNPIAGATVVLTAPGATVVPPAGTTSAAGVATGSIHATAAGDKIVSATINGVGVTQTDTVTVEAAAAAQIALQAGNAQTDTVGATLPMSYAVLVTDALGNAKAGVTVTWTVTGGGGSITPSSVTDGGGMAVATRVLGTGAGTGTHTAQAAVTGLSGSPVLFTASATSGTATTLALAGGNAQADTVDAVLAPYTVLVTDAFGNPKAGITVNWAVTSGGGSVTVSSVTNGAGIATATATLGTAVGTQIVEATVSGLSGSPVVFTATVNPGKGSALIYTVQPGDTPAGDTITPAVAVRVNDRHGNLATTYAGNVTVAIAFLTGNPGGVLLGTTTKAVVAGVVVFDDLSITLPNTLLPPYRLDITSGTLPLVTSISFNIT